MGPDGAVYFCTGGRGTDGGIYRVVYTGDEADTQNDDSALELALQQPQLDADWARAKVARLRAKVGNGLGPRVERSGTRQQPRSFAAYSGIRFNGVVRPPPPTTNCC